MFSDNGKKRAGPNGGGASPAKRRKSGAAGAGALTPDPAESPRPSLSIKSLLLPEDVVDLSPKSEDVVWAELRRCASDGGGRLSIANARKAYQITQRKAGTLMSVVDLNLTEAEIEAGKKRSLGCGNKQRWSDKDDDIIVREVSKEMNSGKHQVRRGFWKDLADTYFPGKSSDAVRVHWNVKLKGRQTDMKSGAETAEIDEPFKHSNSSGGGNEEGESDGERRNVDEKSTIQGVRRESEKKSPGGPWTEDENTIIAEAVRRENEHKAANGRRRARNGFWKQLSKALPHRSPQTIKSHWFNHKQGDTPNDNANSAEEDHSEEHGNLSEGNENDESDDGGQHSSEDRTREHFSTHDEDSELLSVVCEEMKRTGGKTATPSFWKQLASGFIPGRATTDDVANPAQLEKERPLQNTSEYNEEDPLQKTSEGNEGNSPRAAAAKWNPESPKVTVPDESSHPARDLIMLPDYQAARATFPPGSLVVYCALEEASVKGTIKEVGLLPSRDLLVYTFVDENGVTHEQIPEHNLTSAPTSN